MGTWALWSVRRGTSLSESIGGTRAEIPVGISLGLREEPDALVAAAEAAWRRGYRRIKLKIAPGADVDYVRAVRTRLPEAPLSVDANAADDAADVHALLELDELGLEMIEQPFDGEDLVRHADLQRRLRTPICLDESITSADRASDMLRLGSGRIVNIKPGRVGGYAAALAIHDLCIAGNVPVWCGGMLESGIGRAYNVALASLPGFVLPGDLSPSDRYWERDVVIPEWTMSTDGTVAVPRDRPGLGVAVDEARVDALTVRRERIAV
jgi:O-succinylbenzoate synthase